uniref:Uncharacterized protein n=1 Tax=Latimeria chalumnae TaxID=7897 RepID=H3B3H2_LATCH
MDFFSQKANSSSEKKSESNKEKECRKRVQKYDEAFLEFGFTSVMVDNEEKAKCVLCHAILSVESMKPNKLKRHLETQHKEHVGKPKSFFQRRKDELACQTLQFRKALTVSKQAQRASFVVSYCIAQCKRLHTFGEMLLLPVAIDMVRIICGETEANKMKDIPLSNNTVKQRIDAIDADQENTLEHLQKTEAFALQVDVSTEGRDAHFLAYVHIWKNDIVENILFCLPLPSHEMAQGMFEVLQSYMQEKNISWDRLVGFCTDGAPSVAGYKTGLRTLVKKVAASAVWTYMIHKKQRASGDMSSELSDVLQHVVSIINLYATDWKKTEFVDFLCDEQKMCLLAYLTDIFKKLNKQNASLQGRNTHILPLIDRISGFMKKIEFWRNNLIKRKYETFPQLCNFLTKNENIQPPLQVMIDHLCQLEKQFGAYFPDLDVSKYDWM